MGIKPFLRLWDSREPRSEPISTNGENLEQWWTFPGVNGLPKLLQEDNDDSSRRSTSKELQASLASIKVSVHDSTIRKTLGKNSIHEKVPRLTKQNTKSSLTFARTYLYYPQDFWANILWYELFGRCVSRYIWSKTNTGFHQKNIILTVKHGGGSVTVWGCFADSGPGWLAIIDGTMNSALYQKIMKKNVQPSVCDLKLKRTWVMQQEWRKQNEGFGVAKSKSRLKSDWDAVAWP